MRFRAAVVVLAVTATATSALPGPIRPAAAAAGFPRAGQQRSAATAGTGSVLAPERLRWNPCPGGLQCATFRVPIDYQRPTSDSLNLALVKSPATKPKKRLGSLFINPGGPGASAVTFVTQVAASPTLAKIHERYDFVGWDPRGVGASTPIRCLDQSEYEQFFHVDQSPDNDAEVDVVDRVTRSFVDGCKVRNPKLFAHLSTADSVADLERIRAAIGEAKISFLGFSYGTYLGLLYADRYPTRVDKFVLDGIVDPTLGGAERLRAQAAGFEVALTDFLQQCRGANCPWVYENETPRVAFERLMAGFETKPVTVRSTKLSKGKRINITREVGPAEALTAVIAALYNKAVGWPQLRLALADADDGNASRLLALFDLYSDRSSTGLYGNIVDANSAVNCSDLPRDGDLAFVRKLADEFSARYPNFGAFAAYSVLPCTYWPTPGPPPRAVKASGSSRILVIGTTKDPATPLSWAINVTKSLSNAVLLTFENDGHTALLTGNRCVVDAVQDYMLDGRPPVVGTVCDG